MENRLHWRRQFLLTRGRIDGLVDWNRREVRNYCLYSHPDLEVTVASESGKELVLIGYLFDPVNYTKTNAEILGILPGALAAFSTLLLRPSLTRDDMFLSTVMKEV